MDPSEPLQIDEHLARLLAAYDQGIGDADAKAPTINVPASPRPVPPGEEPVGPLPGVGSAGEVLPDSKRTWPFHPAPGPKTPPPAPTPSPGPHRVGRFELRRQLGRGGMGLVFLAHDPQLQREVALKIPRPEMLLSPDARRRLIREAQAAAEFDHPNLVPVYETGEIGPVCYIATAFCPGQTLAEWLDRQAYPVPVRQAARLVAQLAEAVQHAHDRGVLHRDLKPTNVILQAMNADPNSNEGPPPGSCPLRGEHYLPRVVDFGLAKLAERGPSETATRQILGTPKYMAPEQAQGRHEDVGPAADVYALGVILYECLAGRPPYEGPTDVEVLRQVVDGDPTPPRNLRPDLPRDLEAICLKALARSPGKRYRTAIDLADDLRRFLDGLPTLARPLNRLGRAARFVRRNDQAVALGVVTSIALFFLIVGLWNLDQTRQLRSDRDRELAAQTRANQHREYARHVRDAFLSWRAGDAQQMADSLAYARTISGMLGESPEFAWGYLAQLGRVERLSVACPAGAAVALAVSADGARVATGHPDGTLAVWDRATGRPLGAVRAHPGEVTHVAFLDGGSGLVTAGGEASARTWKLSPDGVPAPGPVLPPLAGPVTALAAPPDGRAVYAGSATGECLGWDPAGSRVVKVWLATDGDPLAAVAVSPDGRTVATAGQTGPVRLWAAGTAEPAGEVRGAAGASALAFAPATPGGWLLVAAVREEGTVRLFDPDGREVRALPGHAGPVLTLAASPDGASVASGGRDESVCVWDVTTGSIRALLRGHEKPVRGVRFGPDGRTLVTASDDGLLKVWDLTADPEGQSVRGLPAAVAGVAMHPDGRGFAVALADGSVELYPHRGATPRRVPANGRGPLGVLRLPADRPAAGVELAGRAAAVWEFGEEPRVLFRAALPGRAVTAADLSPAGTHLAAGDDRGRVTVWSVHDHAQVATFETGLASPVRHLCFSDDGRRLAAQTAGQAVGVWELGDAGPRFKVAGHGDGLWLVRFLPGGERLVTAGRGSSIKMWDLTSGREELALLGHVGRVTGLAVSPDGRTLVSGSGTGEVKLWDLWTGQELVGLRRHTGPVAAAEFAAGGQVLITGGMTAGGRGELAFWEAARE